MVLALVDDLMFRSKIKSTATALGVAVTFAADLRAVAAILEVRAETADKSRQVPLRRVRRSKAPWIAAAIAALAAAAGALWWFFVR